MYDFQDVMGIRRESFPDEDALDFARGVRFVPGEVTVARRKGRRVLFVQDCACPCCWYWQFDTGSRTYHYERYAHDQIAELNGFVRNPETGNYPGNCGACPTCGNTHLRGCHFPSEDFS